MRQKVRDIFFLILGVSLTILFFTVVIPVLVIIGLIKVISMIKHFINSHKYAKINP
ncbi:MAG TPA: hypothetical protein IAB59_06345 [Candidatus Onthousia faecipullorum]|uniref:Uncharacterized protein n=1 Tax=Candidatus Onthousia faecipullorum TaxID=2840887 RepID=A0A9D1GC30_9FIRM|nr:hypothetical protein [Candidatus Onthousia faecipullorum]